MSIRLKDTIYDLINNSDKIDGYHFTDLCSNRPHHFVSANDTSCWYKLITIDVIATGWGDLFYEFEITGRGSGKWGRIRIWTITHNSNKLFGLDPKVTYDGTLGGKFKAYRYTENNIDRFELWMSLGAWETWNFYVRTYEREAGYMTLTWNKTNFTAAPTGFTKEITIDEQDIAGSASKLATPRIISLTGSVTGSGSFDGSGDLNITTTTNHTHNYASTVKVGSTSYNSSSNVISLPAYPTLSSLGAAASSHTHTKAQITDFSHTHSYYPLSGNTNMSGDNVWIGSTMGGGSDYWRIGGYGTGDNGICRITIGDNSNDKFQIQISDYSGTTYTPLEVTNNRLNISGFVDITANGRTLTIGSQNADHCHYSTDAPCHWFNKSVRVAGDIYGGSNYNNRLAYVYEVALSGHTHNYAGSDSVGGTANAAKKLELVSSGITTTTNDTTANWGPLGSSVHFVSKTGQLNNQPHQYGMILNMSNGGSEVAQLWFTQNIGTLYHRQGNSAGWGCNWTAILDSSNYSTWVAAKTHTHNYAGSSSPGGAATSANKLSTARTISLTGSVTGSGSFDGSGNLSIATTTNHSHNYAGSSSAGGPATSADKLNTNANAGDRRSPVYFSGGAPVACDYLNIRTYHTIDASALSTSNFYPVTFAASDVMTDCEIHSPSLSGTAAYNQNVIHFQLIARGWSDTPKLFKILHHGVYSATEVTIGAIGSGNEGGVQCVWVRGGMSYRFYCNKTPVLRTANISNGNEIFTVGTGYSGGTNTKVTVHWKYGETGQIVCTAGHTHNYAPASHTHTKAQITDFSHTHNYAGSSSAGGDANNSVKWGGYKIVVGSTGTATDTIYFVT